MTHFEIWKRSWLRIAEGVVSVCSFTYFQPKWSYRYFIDKLYWDESPECVEIGGEALWDDDQADLFK